MTLHLITVLIILAAFSAGMWLIAVGMMLFTCQGILQIRIIYQIALAWAVLSTSTFAWMSGIVIAR